MKAENGNPRPVRPRPTFARMVGADGDLVDVAIFADGTVVERMETAGEAYAKLYRRALKRCGGRLEDFESAWRHELKQDPHLKKIAAR